MANAMTNAQYQVIKNERYTIIRFKDGKRISSIAGCSAFRVVQELVEKTRSEMVVLVINENDIDEEYSDIKPNIEDYEKYFKMERKLF